MFSKYFFSLLSGCSLWLLVSSSAVAVEATEWALWINRQIGQHPEIQAAQQELNASLSSGAARRQPLYNPEIETSFEREGQQENYSVGLRQTLDLWDKQGRRSDQVGFMETIAKQTFTQRYNRQLLNTIKALLEWSSAKERYVLAEQQERQLDELIALAQKRQQAGDLGAIDVELSMLSLSQKLNDTASAIAAFKSAETAVRSLLPEWSPSKGGVPEAFWLKAASELEQKGTDRLVEEHPAVVRAKAFWKFQLLQAELAKLAAKSEVTVGVTAGRNGEEKLVGFNLSMPLNIRNNFSDDKKAAMQSAFAAESDYLSRRRSQRFDLIGSAVVVEQYQKQLTRWRGLMARSRDESKQLLNRQWRTGDLSTGDYLRALQQRADGLEAGIDLQYQFRLALLKRLQSAGQLKTQLLESEI